jgi:formylglycine-generating enzyme required for sulfatase activity
MLRYLAWLNREEQVDKSYRQDTALVQQAAKAIAWECLKVTYRPSDADRRDVLNALATLAETPISPASQTQAEACLRYLDKTLRLVQIYPSGQRLRIILDPVAEYLAALHLIDYCQQSDESAQTWKTFLKTVDEKPDLASIRGFLLAVRNGCEPIQKKLPEGVLDTLTERANLNPEELEQARRRQRINKLIDDLYDSDPKYLGQAIRNLAEEGSHARRAIPDLEKVLKSPQQDPDLRGEAITALLQIQTDKAALDHLLRNVLADLTDIDAAGQQVRAKSIDGLLALKHEPEELKGLLQQIFHDPREYGTVRVRAGNGLRQLGVLQDLLVVTIADDDQNTHSIKPLEPPKTQVFELADDVTLTMVSIPGGTFMMGLPETEEASYDDERPQHLVTIEPFWMGEVPVTQAQYQAIMGRNPSTFQGAGRSNYPVERVNWYDAVAFCQRLSALTSLEFRLPSEAEWEYACRAGTTTPFHFGATITTDLANYRGIPDKVGDQTYPGHYGKGPTGAYREETTEVGQFPPNRFGLYDMHGNVWEWCADHWYESYEEAPTDGSARISDNNNTNRLLRGGAWSSDPLFCRSACRSSATPGSRSYVVGFRVVSLAARALP